ncbi:MAG TPA: elongation factor G [Chthoniobacterales bacterium]
MATPSPADLRNFAIAGHASSGKTMLSEAMLACAGVIGRMGNIAQGTTVSDYHVSEKQHQISTQTSLLHCRWMDKKLNILDTPGYLDFISEALAAVQVADFALVVVHAQEGIGVGTERVWKCATGCGIPKVIVVNAVDKQNAHFDEVLADARAHYGPKVFPLNVPINPGAKFNQVLDVLRSEVVTYETDGHGKFREEPATGEWKDRATQLHHELIELIAESDDTLLNKFFEQGSLSEEELRAGIHAAVQAQMFIPLFCTAATSNVGVGRLLDFIAKYGSSPLDRAKVDAEDARSGAPVEVKVGGSDPVLQVFKTMNEEHFGELSFFRIYSGQIATGGDLFNVDRNATERIGQIFLLNGQTRETVSRLGAGDIGATVKLKSTHTGDTLCTANHPVKLPVPEYPRPNIHAALQPKARGEEDKVAAGLATLHNEDPAFVFRADPELHQTIISAQGELHLEVIAERLGRRFRVHFDLIEPRVPYRETIHGRAGHRYRHKKQTGGAGQFAEVELKLAPAPRNAGIRFSESLSGQCVDRVFVPSVERGIEIACAEGILAGCRVVDVEANFYDGQMHPVDSKDIAFQVAGYWAFKEAFLKARPCLLEPINSVEVRTPEDCMGKIVGDLSSRRGRIIGTDADGQFQIVRAEVPAMELYRYASILRSLTGGRGVHSEEFSRYEEMPREIEQRVIEEAKKTRAGGSSAAR